MAWIEQAGWHCFFDSVRAILSGWIYRAEFATSIPQLLAGLSVGIAGNKPPNGRPADTTKTEYR
jgi:hypothetical protein